jgi:hypothetical protein
MTPTGDVPEVADSSPGSRLAALVLVGPVLLGLAAHTW